MKKTKYIVCKALRGMTLLCGLSLLSFAMMHFSPIDPISAYLGGDVSITQEQRIALEEHWGLGKPAHMQYLAWLGNFLSGDFGISTVYRRPVEFIIKERFAASFSLMGFSWCLSGILGFLLGISAAAYKGRPADRVIRWISYTQASVPTFWFCLMMLTVFAVWLGWFPIGLAVPVGVPSDAVTFGDRIRHMALPVATLTVFGIANMALHTREKMIEALESEYALFAKARGESRWETVLTHGLRNVAIPAVTLHFAYFGELFGGSVLAEQVFSYPGLGSTLTEAGLKGDIPLLMGIVMVSAVFVFCGNLIADILNSLIDPRLKEGVAID